MSDSTTAATQQLPPREGLQAAKRRWKVLKRCDQNDPQIKSEIDQIEKDFPEILGLPAPVLSKATRATLEGGAVVSAIENETASAATATTPEELEAADAAKKKDEEVKEKLSQLQNMVKNLEKETTQTNNTNTVETTKPEETQQEPTSTNKKSSSPSPSSPVNQQTSNNNNNQKYLQGAMLAFQAYDSFFISTLPSQIAPDQAEASSALFFAALVVVGQFVTSTGTTTLSSSLSGSGRNSLCDNIVIYLLNPVLWCLPVVLMRMFRLEMAKCKSFVDGVAIVLATGVRFVLVGVCAFTVYSMLFLMLQAVGGVHVPRRFCPE